MSSDVNLPPKRALEQEQNEILQQLEAWLEIPMLGLSFVWLALFVVELIWGLSPLLDVLGITIWGLFILDFGLKFLLAPRKLGYLKQNWLTVLSLLLPGRPRQSAEAQEMQMPTEAPTASESVEV